MHRTGGLFYMGALAALALFAPGAQAVPVTSLYVVVVPGSDPLQAEQAAMRVELVRLIGTRDAASDPMLAMLVDNAHQYVQLERVTTTGQFQVLFDEAALSNAISAAGRTLWGADRPLLWIELPALDATTAATMRMRLNAAAAERGLPITIAAPASAALPETSATPAPSAALAGATVANPRPSPAAQAPTPGSALEAARSAGASAALVASTQPSQPGVLQWTLISPDTGGQWVGSPELAIDAATDALAGASRALAQGPVAQYDCHIDGVSDLPSLVNVLAVVNAAPGVMDVAVSGVQGDQLILHLQARGSQPQLRRALESERLQAAGTGPEGELLYRYVGEPASAPDGAAPVSAPTAPAPAVPAPGAVVAAPGAAAH